jgi:hypothetical protein
MDDEPIRFLTHEQFEAHRASILASRQAHRAKQPSPQSEVTKSQSAPPKTSPELFSQSPGQEPAKQQDRPNGEAKDLPSPQVTELGSQIWEMRTRGLSCYEVHRRVGIPMEAVRVILAQFEGHFYPEVGAAMSSRLALDDQRLDDLFRTWLPIATGGPIEVKKVDRKGREYTERDTDTPLKAAGIVLTAIQRRIQLTMAVRPPEGAVGKDGSNSTNVLVWLSQILPSLPSAQKVVDQVNGAAPVSRGKQALVLECAAEADLAPDNSNGSIR